MDITRKAQLSYYAHFAGLSVTLTLDNALKNNTLLTPKFEKGSQ